MENSIRKAPNAICLSELSNLIKIIFIVISLMTEYLGVLIQFPYRSSLDVNFSTCHSTNSYNQIICHIHMIDSLERSNMKCFKEQLSEMIINYKELAI